jgi:hypothetical protein
VKADELGLYAAVAVKKDNWFGSDILKKDDAEESVVPDIQASTKTARR